MKRQKTFSTLVMLGALAALSGCQTSADPSAVQARSDKINAALERAAINAAGTGEVKKTLAYLEQLYKRNSNDEAAALRYAEALRKTDYLNRAGLVLAPFAKAEDSSAEVNREYAAIQLALGYYDQAERFAQKAIVKNEKDYKAYHYLGISLDARNMHEAAERAFRKALDYWEGDPTPVMNNLALNLASQGFLDEAMDILHQAQSVAPHRIEIERNLRIVRALKQSHHYTAPKPGKKPEPEQS